MKENDLDNNDVQKLMQGLLKLDWDQLINNSTQINNSIECIKELIDCNLFNVSILTHVTCWQEAKIKLRYFDKLIPGLRVIPVYKPVSKANWITSSNDILIDDFKGNLRKWKAAGGIGVRFVKEKKEEDTEFIEITSLLEIIDLVKDGQIPKREEKVKVIKKINYL